ncbi:MAG: SMP-30/gluconolactonase/LRE family protein [Chlorobi bacterium]|nr:SMP-30/gluconolactonase/LRE family protein [Chlorobiota bacterium]
MTANIVPHTPKAKLGEGTIWHPDENVLYWIDILGCKLHRYDPKTGTNTTIETDSMIGTVVPASNTYSVIIATETGIHGVTSEGKTELLIPYPDGEAQDNRFNDGKCDPAGRFWVGTMSKKETTGAGNLYCFDGKELKLKLSGVSISNGIVWSHDAKTMYYIDTPEKKVFAFDFDNETGEISNKRTAFEIDEKHGYPDGMTIDEEGMLWIAPWGGKAVVRWNPDTGNIIEKTDIPAPHVTSCAFGGDDLDTLFITTAQKGLTTEQLEQYPLSGSLFFAKSNVKGVPAFSFRVS